MINASVIENTYESIKCVMAYLDENYEQLGFRSPLISEKPDPASVASAHLSDQPLPVLSVYGGATTYRLTKPILVRIYRDGDWYLAENDNLMVFGTGETAQEAIEDFSSEVIHFSEYYGKLGKEKLRGEGLRLKKLYEGLLVEERNAD